MFTLLRNIIFRFAYLASSVFFILMALPFLLIPSRKPLMAWILGYTKTMCFLMRWVAGVKITIRGKECVPDGPCIIAAKHQSWGDGFVMFSQFSDLAFVTGDHLEKFPLVGGILRKMGAIIVDNCGGAYARARLVETELKNATAADRKVLIYPEGHLSPVGHHYRYKKGVYHMYEAYNCPVVPVATNLGLCWPQQSWRLNPGEAAIEFLEPIEPGLGKTEFMERLQHAIETQSMALLGKANTPQNQENDAISILLPDPQKG